MPESAGPRSRRLLGRTALGSAVGYQDTAVAGQIVESADEVSSLMLMWDTLKSEALPRSASLELLEEVAKTWT
jgi:Domain of unknown function (DUF5753)